MAGSISLDSVDTSKAASETTSTPAPEINTQAPEAAESTGQEAGNTSAETSVETAKDSAGGGQPAGNTEATNVGTKTYSQEEHTALQEKSRRLQSDRDRSEAVLGNFVKQIRNQGLDVDNSMNIVRPPTRPVVNEPELREQAAAGDPEAMQKLLDYRDQQNFARFEQSQQKVMKEQEILSDVRKTYPELYTEAGEINYEHPLTQEVDRIIKQTPELGQPKYMKQVVRQAKLELQIKGLPKHEQEIKNNAQRKFNQSSAAAVGSSAGTAEADNLSGLLTEQQKVASAKMGLKSDRISKLVKKAQKEGGYYL